MYRKLAHSNRKDRTLGDTLNYSDESGQPFKNWHIRTHSRMRLSYFLVVALTGLLACASAVDSEKTFTVSHNQVRFGAGVNNNEQRFLRAYPETDDSEVSKTAKDAKTAEEEDDSEDSEEERKNSIKLVKRSIYAGYVKYYDKHCTYYDNREKAFCKAKEY
ncbi:hypothetical protein AM587_10006076 [Phytophthora nicotianae]|uniref:RxLR effector protein n=1 Tax=Phytophthora nicotianae TaxID=4792 RepID=A0A0W8CNP3_PHYNI|nr:hypothetical protein AM587_10006076 [Phytophthora nicotianae]